MKRSHQIAKHSCVRDSHLLIESIIQYRDERSFNKMNQDDVIVSVN